MKPNKLSDDQEAQRIKNNLGACPFAKYNTTRAVAKKILLDGWFFYNGRQCTPKAKSIGLGVYEMTVEVERD